MTNTTSKAKVLWLSDFNCATGFATVGHNIVKRLHETGKYDIDVIGINHTGDPYDYEQYPYNIYPATNLTNQRYHDVFGRQKMLDMLGEGKYDILFTLQDTFVIKEVADKIIETKQKLSINSKFSWIFYYPIDGKPKQEWITRSAYLADFPICYTEYGYKESVKGCEDIKHKLKTIEHGVDAKQFKPLSDYEIDEAKKTVLKGLFKESKGRFIFTNINRNQPRKDIFRTIQAFAKLRQKRDDVFLYLHMQNDDVGVNISEVCNQYGLELGKDWTCPGKFTANQGVSVEVLNMIYNISDCVISTTLGEGWGLSSIEAMATRTPVIMPDNTALTEILNNGKRGVLVKSGNKDNHKTVLGHLDFSVIRPVVDVEDMVSKMDWLVENKDTEMVKSKIDNAYKYTQELDWDKVSKKWLDVFDKARKRTQVLRNPKAQVSRNDPCPCHSGKKFKKCCGK